MKNLIKTVSLVLVMVSLSFAQTDKTGKFGFGIDGVSSPNLACKYFVNSNTAFELTFGADIYSPGGDAPIGTTKVTGTDIRTGIAFLYHFGNSDFSPFAGIDEFSKLELKVDFLKQKLIHEEVFKLI